jgi:PA domain-containing protein
LFIHIAPEAQGRRARYARGMRSPRPVLAAAALLALLAGCARGPAPGAAAEASIQPEALARDVAWLAAPARAGRGTGTPGGAAAAAWVAERMRAVGLAPAGEGGSFLQPFEAPVGARLAGENALRVAGRDLAALREWLPFTFSETGEAKGELVWAGHGITALDVGHDDYAGLDVKGKVVLVAEHFPRESEPTSPFRDPSRFQVGEWRYKAMNARDHGAAGMIGVRDDWNHPGDDALEPFR